MTLRNETVARYRRKANAVSVAWERRFGRKPSVKTVIAVLCVAQHETACGDAWPGEYNWGACTLRSLSAAENAQLMLFGIWPTVANRTDALRIARYAQETLVSHRFPVPSGKKLGVVVPRAAIHCDSRPIPGPPRSSVAYFTWFAAFNNDVDGAEYLLAVLCGHEFRKAAYSVLVTDADLGALARAMYNAGYYTGFYHKTTDYNGVHGSELNIASYVAALKRVEPAIAGSLRATVPETVRRGSRGEAVQLWQLKIGTNPDGIFGIMTMLATRLWQKTHGLKADGIVGQKTWTKAGFMREAWTP